MKFLKNCTGCARRRAKMKKAFNNIIVPKLNIYSRLSMFQERLWNNLMDKPYMGHFDNVAGVRFHKEAYGTIGAKQRLFGMKPGATRLYDESVSVTVFANAAGQGAAGGDTGLTTQIDRGLDNYDVTPDPTSPQDCDAFGYNVTGEGYLNVLGSFGTMDDAIYDDGGSTSRTIKAVYYTEPCSGSANDDVFFFSIDRPTADIPNNDTTWTEIDWDDIGGTPVTIDRSVNTTYTANLNGSSHWRWLATTGNWADQDINTDFVLTVT